MVQQYCRLLEAMGEEAESITKERQIEDKDEPVGFISQPGCIHQQGGASGSSRTQEYNTPIDTTTTEPKISSRKE